MAKYNSTCLLEVNICYQEKTGHVVVADNMTIGNFIPIAINSLLNEKGSTEKYRIIYAGSILKNEILLKDIRLYTASILHIVNMDKKNYLSSKNQSQEFQYSLFNYYVYCYECKDIASAKLRIKCLECNMCHDFLIDNDHEPKCREDILSYDGNIPGTCNYTRCTGRSAKFEFYCHKHPMKNAVLLKHIFNNSHHYRCITCEEDLNPILIYPCKNGHVMCLDCFKIYCFQYLREKKFRLTSYCYSIRCPDHCDQSFIQEAHHFRILGNIKYDEYQTQATDAYLQNTYSINCPNPHCNECFEAEMNLTEVTCYSCKHKFCRQCSNEAHVGPCGREPVEGSDVYSENEMSQQSASLIHKISKKCPKCEVNIEKNGGCNHMICKCEAEWCWICGKRWSPACVEDHWFD